MKGKIVGGKVSLFLLICLMIPFLVLINPMTVFADDGEADSEEELDITDDSWATAFSQTDPWEILAGNNDVEYFGGKRFAVSLYELLLRTLILFCMIVGFACIIAIPWINSSEKVKANKEKLTNLLLIMGLGFLAVPIFNFGKYLLDTMFGL